MTDQAETPARKRPGPIPQEEKDRIAQEESKYSSAEWMTRRDAEVGVHPLVTPYHPPLGRTLLEKLIKAGLIHQEKDPWGGWRLWTADVVRESNFGSKSWLTQPEVANLLHVSVSQVKLLAKKGALAPIPDLPGHPLYYRGSVEELAGGAGI